MFVDGIPIFRGSGKTAEPAAITVVTWAPTTATVRWGDKNGTFTGNLAEFNDTADYASVSGLAVVGATQLTAISHLGVLPSLNQLDLEGQSLTTLNLTGCSALGLLFVTGNSLTSLDVTPCPLLAQLECGSNALTSLKVTGLTTLFDVYCQSNNLTATATYGINALLNVLAAQAVALSNGTVNCSGQTPVAPPTLTGITAKATLVANGWTVTTD